MDHTSSYAAQYPTGVSVASDVQHFFREFYRLSDTPDAHEEYSRVFADDARFILASRDSQGRPAILATRKNMWAAVDARKHTVHKVFPFGPDADEYMLFGTVAYTMKDGNAVEKDWAARAQLTKEEDGTLVFKFYQVYLDTGSVGTKNS